MSRREAAAVNMTEEKQRGGKTDTVSRDSRCVRMNGRLAPVLHLREAAHKRKGAVWHQEENEAAASLLLGLFLCSTARQ